MDAGHFDRLVSAWSRWGSGRRTLLAVLATLPLLGGLSGLFDLDEVDAHGRRKRRKKRHKHGKGRRRGKKGCKSQPRARTCQGRCGQVKNNCKKSVNCGPCTCETSSCSGACCAEGCVDLQTDPNNCGACGVACLAGHTCQGGACRVPCGGTACNPASEICVDEVCQTCDVTCNTANHTCSGTDLQTALDGGGTVYVCPGRYIGGFTLSTIVNVIGAGQGGEAQADTILDGQGLDRVLDVESDATASLTRVRITGGAFPGLGAGVYNLGDLTLTECTVTANTASDGQGGGLFNAGSASLTMTDCTVSNNTTTGTVGSRYGAGIAGSFGGTVTLTGCTISGNRSAAGGGGIQNDGTLEITDCTIEANRAENGDGGGIRDISGIVTLTGGRVEGNYASNVNGGGGLYTNGAGSLTITGTIFQNNDPNNCTGTVCG